jgi:hypothetical protein
MELMLQKPDIHQSRTQNMPVRRAYSGYVIGVRDWGIS